MTELQIRDLIRRCERHLKREIWTPTLAAWTLAAGCAPFAISGVWFEMFWTALIAAAGGVTMFFGARRESKLLRKYQAQRIWKHLSHHGGLITNRAATPATKRLFSSIGQLYFRDPNGEMLPLSQALRLLDTHHRQQQRLMVLDERLAVMSGLRWRLQEKLATLRELGETSESGEQLLLQLGPDEENVCELKRQIEASCARLELLLPGIERALQVRLLHREVSQMSDTVSQNNHNTPQLTSDENAGDIERQITREIETYLQLERESEAHFR